MDRTQKFFLLAILINLIYLVITFVFFYYLDNPLMSSNNNDYLSFHNAGLLVINNISDLYNSSLYLFPFRYFPISAYFFTPFSLLGLKTGYFVFQSVNFFLNIIIFYLIYRIIQIYKMSSVIDPLSYKLDNFIDIYKKNENHPILLQYAILLIMLPQFMNYFLGQINTVVSLFLLSSVLLFLKGGNKNDFYGGFLLGLGILFKPSLLILLPFIISLIYNNETKKLTIHLKISVIRLLGPIILIMISGIYFLIFPQMLEDFIEVNLAGKYTYNIGGNVEINPSFSLTRITLIIFDLTGVNLNNFLVFIIITLIILIPIYIFFIRSKCPKNKLIIGYFTGLLVMLIVYYDSWPHHLVVLAPFLIIFILIHKEYKKIKLIRLIHYFLAVFIVVFWGIFYLSYEILPFNIGSLILFMFLYFNLIIFYKNNSKVN